MRLRAWILKLKFLTAVHLRYTLCVIMPSFMEIGIIDAQISQIFRVFTARCYASAVLAMALCPSVCPSQAGVLLKRQNVGSHKQHHTIPQGF